MSNIKKYRSLNSRTSQKSGTKSVNDGVKGKATKYKQCKSEQKTDAIPPLKQLQIPKDLQSNSESIIGRISTRPNKRCLQTKSSGQEDLEMLKPLSSKSDAEIRTKQIKTPNRTAKNDANDIHVANIEPSAEEIIEPVHAALTTSTPLKILPSQRELFKEINLTIASSVFNYPEIPVLTQEQRDSFRKLSLSKSKQNRSENLTRKCDLIEHTISSNCDNHDADKERNYQSPVDQCTSSAPVAKKTHKFFNRGMNESEDALPVASRIKNPSKGIKKRSKTKRKSGRDAIYDFFGQSQTSESEDIAADVVKRLVEEGKARVAKLKKGTGKPALKRKNILKKQQVKQPTKRKKVKKEDRVKKPDKNKAQVEISNSQIHGVENMEDANTIDLHRKSVSPSEFIGVIEVPSKTYPVSKRLHDNSMTEGTFSDLARSVMVSQAEKAQTSRKMVNDPRKLLEMVQKIVSTPSNKISPKLNEMNISPISSPYSQQIDLYGPEPGNTSPWRINEDCHLPKTFYFSRNAENLPSFSSDHMPSTPRKHRKDNLIVNNLFSPSVASLTTLESTNTQPVMNSVASTLPQSSPVSSFSSNDSNAENIPPILSEEEGQTDIESTNDAAINKRHQLNPLKDCKTRDPLKTINILEVITLPPLISEDLKRPSSVSQADENILSSKSESTLQTSHQSQNLSENLFGFDEYITNEDFEEDQLSLAHDIEETNLTFEQKLRQLKELRPSKNTIASSKAKHIQNIFDADPESNQLKIDKMLSGARNPVKSASSTVKQKDYDENAHQVQKEMFPTLFSEPEREVFFNKKEIRRTYERPRRRKRKLRHNFILFHESDVSSEEEEEQQEKGKELENKKKKYKKEIDPNKELDEFAKEFNDMCKEVEQYQIVVE